MKILLMSPWGDRDIGGLSSHLLSLERVIALAGHESHLSSHGEIPVSVQKLCWFLSRVWPGSRLKSSTILLEVVHGAMGLREAIRGDTRLVHAHDVACLPAAKWIARFIGAPVVLTVHSQYALGDVVAGYLRRGSRDERFAWSLELFAFRNADFVFTVTTRLRDFVLNQGKVDPARVTERLNFVDTTAFQPREPALAREVLQKAGVSLGPAGPGRRLVLYPGRLSPRKGVDVLVRAARKVVDARRDVLILITGDGPQLDELMKLRTALGLEDHITFMGNLPSGLVKYVYNVADVVVLPSVTIEGVEEGTPMSALEAMASGVPLVCSAVGGLAEIVVDGETGYLVPEGSPEQLAERLLSTLEQDQAAVIGRALRYVREQRSLDSYAKELEQFLRECGAVPAAPADRRGPAP